VGGVISDEFRILREFSMVIVVARDQRRRRRHVRIERKAQQALKSENKLARRQKTVFGGGMAQAAKKLQQTLSRTLKNMKVKTESGGDIGKQWRKLAKINRAAAIAALIGRRLKMAGDRTAAAWRHQRGEQTAKYQKTDGGERHGSHQKAKIWAKGR